MQLTSSYDKDYLKEYAPNIQAFAPMIETLSEQERFSLIKMIANIPLFKKQIEQQEPLAPLDVQLFDYVYMSDDFNDELGDEFWFGKDA